VQVGLVLVLLKVAPVLEAVATRADDAALGQQRDVRAYFGYLQFLAGDDREQPGPLAVQEEDDLPAAL
jgi:hypothetical protein